MYYSPLRYPGGKNKLSPFIAHMCIVNGINGHYIEPYSGGASVALFLLFEGFVSKITINDKDRSIYAFWYSVLNKTEQLCNLINNTEVTIDEWKKQKRVQENKQTADLLELGFSTFFLNRTNHSGIINGGMIGGIKQNSKFNIDCRFNKSELINRIRKIASRRKDICLYEEDALDLIKRIQNENNYSNTIIYFDPPYYYKAKSLYMNHYKKENHKFVSETIQNLKGLKWIVSYDNVPEIQQLYSKCDKIEYCFKHTAHCIKIGKEILFFSPNLLDTIELDNRNPINYKFRRSKKGSSIVYISKSRS